ncbi:MULTISPECIES: hypothetical protein [unclassified Amycolatopsis]|uniref:hypothetical protein n=1 Tax=unclassified Amycolatopsis TaxID=2618356 RepID=UPI001C69DC9A|nr:hypothetical protein [Amycolatopsis sp. DSM 110486]QYN20825.1 hypothetical protein K1T34_51665 [Amycolatopsis sp. DSM 110486]
MAAHAYQPVHRVADGNELARELDSYLAEGYDIERAADGWLVLRRGSARITVVTAATLPG